jgi:hypothetical protein
MRPLEEAKSPRLGRARPTSSPRAEAPELLAKESEEDQIAIPTVHETILSGSPLDPEAQPSEHPNRLVIIGECTRMYPVKAEIPESGGDQ